MKMGEFAGDAMLDASAVQEPAEWLEALRAIGRDAGSFQTLGAGHHALFLDNSPTLLVSFDTLALARGRARQLPMGLALADECDWSHLCLLSEGGPWFRDPAVYAHVDRLIDEGFFEGFDRVLFYGAGPLGHPAAAYSVAAPGARVLLLNPFATLAPALAGWDNRHRAARRLDFTSRYGYGPAMLDSAAQALVIFDPLQGLDAMQAALYAAPRDMAPHVQGLAARRAGSDLEAGFARLGILNHLICEAMAGTLTPARFGTLWRQRREDITYLRQLQAATSAHPAREIRLCRNVATRLNQNRFRKRLNELLAKA